MVPYAGYVLKMYFIELNAPNVHFQPRHNLPRQLVFLEHGLSSFDGLLACVSILLFTNQWLKLTDRCGLSKSSSL